MSGTRSAFISGYQSSLQMDRFIPQFYTLVCQLLQSLSGSSSSRWSHDESGDPLISEWLQADLNADQLLSYFPSHLRKSLVSHSHSTGGGRRRGKSSEGVFKSVSISELLAHFKSYVRRHEVEACERKLLAGKTKLLESLTERNAHLEEQVLGMRRTEVGVYTNSSVEPLVMSALNKGHLSMKDTCFNSELLLFTV